MAKDNGTQRWADKQVFTTGEAAEICKVSQQTIIRCFDSGRLQGFRVPGSRFRRIPRVELLRFMKKNEIPIDALESSRRRILIVDDDPQIVDMLVDVIGRDERFDVQTANNGYDAGLMTEKFQPHLILLDYMLPDINGTQVCNRIKSNGELRETKIIFVSGVIDKQEIDELTHHGADGFVKKPFDIDVLLNQVAELLEV
jgi:excisionase family DNA binding protein